MSKFSRNIVKTGAILLFLASINACSIGDNDLTVADKYSSELEEVIENNNISRVSVYLLNTEYYGDVDYFRKHNQELFSLEDPFIRVADTYYNLDKLSRYELIRNSEENYLELYFDIYL